MVPISAGILMVCTRVQVYVCNILLLYIYNSNNYPSAYKVGWGVGLVTELNTNACPATQRETFLFLS